MAKLVVSEIAANDLADIWSYVAQEDPEAADRVVDALLTHSELLASRPLLGELREDLDANVRMSVSRPYVVIYRVRTSDKAVEILTILHGARALEAAFRSRYPAR